MTLYEELLDFSRDRLYDFFKNVKLFEGQFEYTDFNKKCFEQMYLNNKQEDIKSVKALKDEIPNLADVCKKCAPYYMKKRNDSEVIKDVVMGRLFEDILIDFFNEKLRIRALHGDNSNKKYPDCMILKKDRGIVAYFEVKYHSAPFIMASKTINRYCYEGSVTLDQKKIIKQLEIIESDLDRPVFYLHWINYPCLKGIFFETSEQVKDYMLNHGEEFVRKEREGDKQKSPQTIYLGKFYTPLLEMGTFEELVELINTLVK